MADINLDGVTRWYRIGLDDGFAAITRFVNFDNTSLGHAALRAYTAGLEHGKDLRRVLGVPDEH